jgi:hypothetical protein
MDYVMPEDGSWRARAGVVRSMQALAARLQEEGAAAFVASWKDLLGVIASKIKAGSKEHS